MNIVIPVAVGIAIGLLFAFRRGPKTRGIARSLLPADRQFVVDQLEPITKLPLTTVESEDAWHASARAAMQCLENRFPDIASVLPQQVYHCLDDADVHRKEPSYRDADEARVHKFIRLLGEGSAKT